MESQSSKNKNTEIKFLLKLFKDSINKAVNISTKQQCMIEDGDCEPDIVRVLQLFELILCHGLKTPTTLNKLTTFFSAFTNPKNKILGNSTSENDKFDNSTAHQIQNNSFWPVIATSLSKQSAYSDETSVENLSSVYGTIDQVKHLTKNNSLKSRFLLRFSMMKKESHDLLTLIKQSSMDCYDPENSILFCDDSFDELYGLLMSLSAIDVEFCLKNDSTDLRAQDSYICWFLSPSYLAIDLEVDAGNMEISCPEKDHALVNQKSYLEQENVLLHNKVSVKNSRIEELEKQLAIANTMNIAIEASLEKFKTDVEEHQGAKDLAREEIDSVKDLLTNETELKFSLETEPNEKTTQVNDLVMALKILERDVSDKRETIQDLNSKNSDLKAVKDELYENYQSEKTSASQLMVSNDELRSGLTRLRKTLENVENDHEKLETSFDLKTKQAASLKGQVEQLGKARDAVSSDLEVERDWRQKLQSELNKHKDLSKQIAERSSKIEELQATLGVQVEEKQEAFTRISELEQSLSELGQKFEDQVVTAEEVRNYVANSVGKGGTWVSDELVSFCKGCDSKFTIARRRHHCRRCGDIFCAKCSSSTKKLTDSSSKAVRVCDICVVELA